MEIDVGGYLEKFRAFGQKPCVERYMALFHPEATLFDSGMERPLTVPEIPDNIKAVLALVPDFSFEIARWRFRDDTLFVLAANRATLADEPIAWESVYCMTLDGDEVRRGRRYYDRAPLFARLNPEQPASPKFDPAALRIPSAKGLDVEGWVDAYTEFWHHADGTRFPAVPDLALERRSWAGDEDLVLIEWLGKGSVNGKPLTLPLVDRWSLRDGVATDGVAYFDSLPILGRAEGLTRERGSAPAVSPQPSPKRRAASSAP